MRASHDLMIREGHCPMRVYTCADNGVYTN